jgi:tRNA-binding EMAP/Myf-like protein
MKPIINYSTFVEAANKLDIRFGVITEIERIPKNKRMIKLIANFGGELNKTVVSNIGGKVEDITTLIGKTFPFILNLEPAERNGIMSEAMILIDTLTPEAGYELLPFVETKKEENV